jgi:hypothetical protein
MIGIQLQMPAEQFGRRMMADRDEPALGLQTRPLARHGVDQFQRDEPGSAATVDEFGDFLVPQDRDALVREQPLLKNLLGAE